MRFLCPSLFILFFAAFSCSTPKVVEKKQVQKLPIIEKKAPAQKIQYSLSSQKGFQPLFNLPKLPNFKKMKYLVGKDPIISKDMNYTEEAAFQRKEKIFSLERKLKMISFSSPSAMGLISELLHLYKSQLYYLEKAYLRDVDSKVYPNKAHFLKVVAGMVVLHSGKLIKHYGHLPQKRSWKVDELISRIRIEDRSAWQEAITLLQVQGYYKGKGRLLSVVKFEAFVNHNLELPSSLETQKVDYIEKTDNENKSIMYLLKAEKSGITQIKKKKKLLIKAIKFARKSGTKGKPGPIFQLSLWRLSELS